MSLVKRVLWASIPRRTHVTVHRWANGAVIPLAILLGGMYRVLTTAATPFEEYLGVAATTSVALGWAAVFVHALPLRHRLSQDAEPDGAPDPARDIGSGSS